MPYMYALYMCLICMPYMYAMLIGVEASGAAAQASDEEEICGPAAGGVERGVEAAAVIRHVTGPVQVAWRGSWVCMCVCARQNGREGKRGGGKKGGREKGREGQCTVKRDLWTCQKRPIHMGGRES